MANEVVKLQAQLHALLKRMDADPGLRDVASIETAEKGLGVKLPADYKAFLFIANGGEALDPLPRFRFYPIEELVARRADGQPPAVVEFGTDDGDGFAFDTKRGRGVCDYPVVRYELGETTRDDVEDVARSFGKFLLALLRGDI